MANSSVVGILKVLLTANTAEFETAMKGVGKDLDKLGGKAFDVSGLIGKIGPALMGAFTIGAVTKVVGDLVATSDALVDLEAKTGIGVMGLQRLKGATEQSGVSLETVAAASLALSKRLAQGKESTVGALTELGLQYAEIRRLSPEDQFLKVGDALGKIGDQNQKVALTNDLLGKQGQELLPALTGELEKTADAYEKLGLAIDEKTIRAGAKLDEQWTVLKAALAALTAEILGPLLPALTDLSKALIAVGTYLAPLAKGFLTVFGAPVQLAIQSVGALTAAIDLLKGTILTLPELPKALVLKAPEVRGAKPLSPDEIKDIERELTASAQEAIRKNKELHKAALVDRTKDVRAFYNWLGEREIQAVADNQKRIDDQEAAWREYFNWLGERRMEDDARAREPILPGAFDPMASLAPLKAAVQAEGPNLGVSLGDAMLGGFNDVFARGLGSTLMAAVTGGGNLLESAGSLLGQSLTTGLSKFLKLTGPWGELVSGLGAMLGPLLGKLFGGVSAEVKKARTELEGFQRTLRATLTDTQKAEAGSEAWKQDVIAVRDAYLATGRTADQALAIVRQLWDTDHPERSQAAIEEINRVLEEQGRIVAANEQAAAEAAEARERELADLQGQLHDLQEQAVVDWEDMREAAQRYGVDVDSLGDAFQGQRIHASAQAIIDDFNLLTRNGANVGGVLFGMREEIAALIRDALKFGTALPENFRPLVAELQRSGNLVDENGDALTDISRLQFGDPIVAKLDAVNEAIADVTRRIEELAAAITGPLVAAFDRIPAVDLRFTEPRIPGAPVNVPMMAAGGIVTAPTLAMIGEGSRPEAVIPLDRLRDGGLGGGIVVLPMIPFTDPYAAAEEAARQFGRRVGGDSHGMREVLEQVIDDWMRTYSPVRA